VMNVSAASISAGGTLFANIFDLTGGSIAGSANINFNLAGNLTTVGDANLLIAGGTIGSDAVINVNAASISAGSALFANIFNSAGAIGGDPTGHLDLARRLTADHRELFNLNHPRRKLLFDALVNGNANQGSTGHCDA